MEGPLPLFVKAMIFYRDSKDPAFSNLPCGNREAACYFPLKDIAHLRECSKFTCLWKINDNQTVKLRLRCSQLLHDRNDMGEVNAGGWGFPISFQAVVERMLRGAMLATRERITQGGDPALRAQYRQCMTLLHSQMAEEAPQVLDYS
jgi:hypothetical protein